MSTPTTGRSVLARPAELGLDAFARRCALHPDVIRRFVALGLLTCRPDAQGELWFHLSALLVVARIQRLRVGLGLNYAAIGLVLDLLDRIEELEAASRRRRTSRWTSTS
jgi:chaperone modulatory protein CbpM